MEEKVEKIYLKICKYFEKVKKDNFNDHYKEKFEVKDISLAEKLKFIEMVVKLYLSEPKEYFLQSHYEIRSIEGNIKKLYEVDNFDQKNFRELIEKSKILIKNERNNYLQIERLKNEILNLELEKSNIIENFKKVLEEMKNDNLKLIDSLEKLTKDKEKVEIERNELMKKSDDIHKKAQELILLKSELEKSRRGHDKDKKSIVNKYTKSIDHLNIKIDHYQKYEKDLEVIKKELFKVNVSNNQLKIENEKLKSEKIKYQFENKQLELSNSKITEKCIKYESQWREAIESLRLLLTDKNLSDLNKELVNQMEDSSFLTKKLK